MLISIYLFIEKIVAFGTASASQHDTHTLEYHACVQLLPTVTWIYEPKEQEHTDYDKNVDMYSTKHSSEDFKCF